jgi:hypothetical protein
MINKTIIKFFLISVCFFSCSKNEFKIQTLEIQPILIDSTINIRALEIDNNKVFSASSTGSIYSFDAYNSKVISQLQYSFDSIVKPNFRALAIKNENVFAISIGNPALLFKNGKVVYKEIHPKVFYDSMEFWNENEGIAVGDFTENCISIIITRDGGNNWNKLDCTVFNQIIEGEGFFAASDTNISIIGNKTWIASGGKNSRVYFSNNKGRTWEIFNTPVLQGESTTGIFSMDFYDQNNGYAIGGDYTKPEIDSLNKIFTVDGGKTWKTIADNMSPGYRSCIQYFPNSKGKKILVVGYKGIDYSNDYGNTWRNFSDESYYTFRFLNDSVAFAAGKGKISKFVFK